MPLKIDVAPSAADAAQRAAAAITDGLRDAIAKRGLASLALSGGKTPAAMLVALSGAAVDWTRVHLFQVDERVVSADNDARNLKSILAALSSRIASLSSIHAMPVGEPDLDLAGASYAALLGSVAGSPSVLDVVHLGLGADGHTASLVPGDAAIDADGDVAITGSYRGLRRMSLTFPIINRARRRVFLVTGGDKRAALERLVTGDSTIVASRVTTRETLIFVDENAFPGG